jgi:hypothetical protein
LPWKENGEPDPAATPTTPIWLEEGQVPWPACGSGHCVTVGIRPTRPGGRMVCSELTYCWPSGRSKPNVKELLPPALAGSVRVLCVGANGGGEDEQPSTVKGLDENAAAPPDHGVNSVSVLNSPHSSGLATAPKAPPLNFRIALLNGAVGFSLKVVVSWPVCGLGVTVPFRRTFSPYLPDSASR